ncbi:sterol desaturase family protein [Flagellimonas flava]|uniref:Sterol desaturase/sphingolipid hydroxylase, fatty acid hydroxylase superfamily n=1 Tax=Flagellimonas flava TaxID=570519 RepID=A0A1M5IIS5_9FLAO|nr:sterol desaturase family protein [Allomuricauda flava]SHG28274.1 Sterol desaturase/sphingolipid hydroxylase, fatty acid hydroxylase superfamily [Allomuricauda flava]
MEDIVLKMEQNIEWVLFGIFAFSMTLAIVEFFYELYKKKINKWRLGEMWASFSVFIVAQFFEKIGTLIFAGSFIVVAKFVPWEIPVNIWTTLLCLLFVDFLYYVEHVIEHKVRILWSYHSIHHSSPIYNYTTALRVSFIDNLITWVFYLPAIVLGFNPYIVLLVFLLVLSYQFWLHTEIIGKLGWFEKIFMTPSQHRVHHGSDSIYLDKNFGALLSIWDRMFGTYQEEKHTPNYGLTKQINTINPIKVHLHEYINIYKDVKDAQNLKEVWGYLVNGPDWKPKRDLDSNPNES